MKECRNDGVKLSHHYNLKKNVFQVKKSMKQSTQLHTAIILFVRLPLEKIKI